MARYSPDTRQAVLSHLQAAKDEVTAVEETSSAGHEDASHLLELTLQFGEAARQAAAYMKSAFAHYADAMGQKEAAAALSQASPPPLDTMLAGMKGGLAMSVILSSIKRVEEANMGYQTTSSVFARTAEGLIEIDGHLREGAMHSRKNLDGPIEVLSLYDQ